MFRDNTGKEGYSSCWQMLLLSVRLAWPLTLVVSRRQLLHYQVCAAGAGSRPARAGVLPLLLACMRGRTCALQDAAGCWLPPQHTAAAVAHPGAARRARLSPLAHQVLFKHLLSLKYAERQLGKVWQAMRASRRLSRCARCVGRCGQGSTGGWRHLLHDV